MIKINKVFLISALLVFLSSCTTNETVEKKRTLLDPEQFIQERSEGIDRSVALGPKIAVNLKLEQKNS